LNMRLEVVIKGKDKVLEDSIKDLGRRFFIERVKGYLLFSFPIKDETEIDKILKYIEDKLPEDSEIINTSLSFRKELDLHGYRITIGAEKKRTEEKEIILKKGLAFGGFHPTTKMCLQLLLEAVRRGFIIRTALDLGTGNGILAIMAKKLGINKVFAVDIDYEACVECKENAGINDVEIGIVCGDQDCIKGRFQLVLVNIIFHVTERIMDRIKEMVEKKGLLIISGFISSRKDVIKDKLKEDGIFIEEKEDEGWGAILWQKE